MPTAASPCYQPLGGSWYGQARLEAGQIFLREGMVVPESQKWRAGGDDSVRGYDYRSLGPEVDGSVGGGTRGADGQRRGGAADPEFDALAVGRASSSMPAMRPTASANSSPSLGAGVGLRWRSPVGPLRLDLAWGQEVRDWRLHFSVGIAF